MELTWSLACSISSSAIGDSNYRNIKIFPKVGTTCFTITFRNFSLLHRDSSRRPPKILGEITRPCELFQVPSLLLKVAATFNNMIFWQPPMTEQHSIVWILNLSVKGLFTRHLILTLRYITKAYACLCRESAEHAGYKWSLAAGYRSSFAPHVQEAQSATFETRMLVW